MGRKNRAGKRRFTLLTAVLVLVMLSAVIFMVHAAMQSSHNGADMPRFGGGNQPAATNAEAAHPQGNGGQTASHSPQPTPSCNGNGPWNGNTGGLTVSITRNGTSGYNVKITADGDGHHYQVGVNQNKDVKHDILGHGKTITVAVAKGDGSSTTITVKADRNDDQESFVVPIDNCT